VRQGDNRAIRPIGIRKTLESPMLMARARVPRHAPQNRRWLDEDQCWDRSGKIAKTRAARRIRAWRVAGINATTRLTYPEWLP